jgi:hypothetical protein
MPCTVKCRCGKAEMRFDKMNPGDIETFECPRCDGEPKAKKADAPPPKAPTSPYGRPLKKQKEQAAKAELVQKEEQAPSEDEE